MQESHCSVSYHRIGNGKLENFALGVRDGWFNNTTTFTTPPITRTVFEGYISDYASKYSAYKHGGTAQKGPFLTAKGVLIGALDSFAVSTDTRAAGDEAIILLGGFVPTKVVEVATVPPDVPVVTVKRGDSTGIIMASCPTVPGATAYGAFICLNPWVSTLIDADGQLVMGPGESFIKLDLKKSRKKKFVGMAAGKTYYIYFYASNAAGVSALSEVRSILCA